MRLYPNASFALAALAEEVLAQPVVPSRNGDTKELAFLQFHILHPRQREILTPDRNASYAAQIAETMWVLAGRNDIGWLSAYLPRAAQFSDDGETWRGGYGPRIRRGHWDVDQLAHVVQLLQEDPDTRRAVINIYDPETDTEPGKDIPCNNWLHLLVRDGALHLHVVARSNDLMWGWSGINAFEWSVLLEVVAQLTDHAIGQMTFSISSLHIYEPYWPKAKWIAGQILDPWIGIDELPRYRGTDIRELDEQLREWFRVEARIRTGEATREDLLTFPDPLFRSWLVVLAVWWGYDYHLLEELGLDETAAEEALLNSPTRKGKR